MTVNELINHLEGLLAGNPHMADWSVNIVADGAIGCDFGTIAKIDLPDDFHYYKATEKEMDKIHTSYIYLQARY